MTKAVAIMTTMAINGGLKSMGSFDGGGEVECGRSEVVDGDGYGDGDGDGDGEGDGEGTVAITIMIAEGMEC